MSSLYTKILAEKRAALEAGRESPVTYDDHGAHGAYVPVVGRTDAMSPADDSLPADVDAVVSNGVTITAADIMADVFYLECGCTVEPDGYCPCGNVSPLIAAGMI